WRDLVAECLADLSDPEGHLLARRLLHVQEVHVDPLRRLGPEIYDGRAVFDRAHERLEHQVEEAWLAQRPLHAAGRALRIRRSRCALDLGIVGAKALLAVLAIDERVGEARDMPARLPDARVHQ